MAEISPTSYEAIAQDYAAAGTGLVGLSQHYYDAAYEVLISTVFDPEIDLLQPFYNAYLASSSLYLNVPLSAISAVGELQRHILNRARQPDGSVYTSIDAWLLAEGVTVPQEFADISALAGFTIAPAYIV